MKTIVRLYYAISLSGERYYLWMLLHIIHGPTCYEDLKRVNGVTGDTFKDACVALGLLDDDSEWDKTLSKASSWATGNRLRHLFYVL